MPGSRPPRPDEARRILEDGIKVSASLQDGMLQMANKVGTEAVLAGSFSAVGNLIAEMVAMYRKDAVIEDGAVKVEIKELNRLGEAATRRLHAAAMAFMAEEGANVMPVDMIGKTPQDN